MRNLKTIEFEKVDDVEFLYEFPEIVNTDYGQVKNVVGAVNSQNIGAFPIRDNFPKLRLVRLPKVMVEDSGTISLLSGEVIVGSEFLNGCHAHSLDGWLLKASIKKTRHISEPAMVLARAGDRIYGHWLVDILYKAYLSNMLNIDVLFLIREDTHKFALELLRVFGVNDSRVIKYNAVEERILLESCYHITPIRFRDSVNPIISEVFAHDDGQLGPLEKKIYLSRKNIDGRKRRCLLNSKEVEEEFIGAGFQIIYPELLSISDQIEIFSRASAIAGEAGSALHNSLFALPEAEVIILQSRSDGSFLQGGLCQAKGQRYTYVFGESLSKYPGDRDASYIIDVNVLKTALAAQVKGH